MPLSNSILSYSDVEKLLDQALDSKAGIRITFDTPGAAIHFRQRCYKVRTLYRNKSKQGLSKDEPGYGESTYDVLQVTANGGTVLIRKIDAFQYDVEDIE